MNSKNLQIIIKGCAKQKREFQEALYQLFASKMYALCLYYSKDKTEAEDLLHNGFIKVFKNIKQYKSKAPFEAWMRKVFTNTALEKFRKERNLISTNEYDETVEDLSGDIISQLSNMELIDLIQKLSPAYRMVFNLYAIEGYSHKEISEQLNISVGTSKSNLARARKFLKEQIKKLYPTIYSEHE